MAERAQAAEAHTIRDSEEPLLPLDTPEVEAACRLFALEDLEIDRSWDINDIIHSCLKDVKTLNWHNPDCAIKAISQLVAISKYIDLRAKYKSTKVCKQPSLKVGIVIAHQIGKGLYFACQIRYNELYVWKHHHLPPCKEYTWHGQYSLLDNEMVLHNMHIYLAAQSLGTVTL